MSSFRILLALLAMSVLSAPLRAEVDAAHVPMGGPAWFADPYAYALIDQDLRAALTEFGQNVGQIVVISDKVKGRARSPLRSTTAGDFLEQLSNSNGLGWYFDGNVLYVNTDDEVTTRLFRRSADLDTEQLRDYLANLDVQGRQLTLRGNPDGDELFVSGPPAYFDMIQQHLDNQPKAIVEVAAPARSIRVFRGAMVSDH